MVAQLKQTEQTQGSIGQYGICFISNGMSPLQFMEEFSAGNIKSGTFDENVIHLVNKQGKRTSIEISDSGLDAIEHLDDNQNEGITYHPQGM